MYGQKYFFKICIDCIKNSNVRNLKKHEWSFCQFATFSVDFFATSSNSEQYKELASVHNSMTLY